MRKPEYSATLRRMLRYIRPYRVLLALSVLAALLSVVSMLVFPLLTGRHAPCAASQSGSGLRTQTERRPLRVTLHGGMRGTAGAHQLETGTGPQAPAMPEGEGGPVFLALLGVKFTPARAAPHISG